MLFLAAVGIPQSTVFPTGLDNPNRRVTLGPMYHDELEFWRWFVNKGLAYRARVLFVAHVQYYHSSTKLTMFTDASKSAFRGYCLQTGHFFRYNFQAKSSLVFAVPANTLLVLATAAVSMFSICFVCW